MRCWVRFVSDQWLVLQFFIDAKTPGDGGYFAVSIQGESNMVRDDREKVVLLHFPSTTVLRVIR